MVPVWDVCRLKKNLQFADSPILLSFPHFYLANDSYRTALDGISPADPEKHKFHLDVQPVSIHFGHH